MVCGLSGKVIPTTGSFLFSPLEILSFSYRLVKIRTNVELLHKTKRMNLFSETRIKGLNITISQIALLIKVDLIMR